MGFEAWYLRRYEGRESEDNYKQTLNLAQLWKRRYDEGYRKGFQAGLEVRQLSGHSSAGTISRQGMLFSI